MKAVVRALDAIGRELDAHGDSLRDTTVLLTQIRDLLQDNIRETRALREAVTDGVDRLGARVHVLEQQIATA